MKEINDELAIITSEQDILCISNLNEQQKNAFELILNKVFASEPAVFFTDGPGGTRKHMCIVLY